MTIKALEQTSRMYITAEMQCEQNVLSQTENMTKVQLQLLGGKSTTITEDQTQTSPIPTVEAIVELNRRARATKIDLVSSNTETNQLLGPWEALLTSLSENFTFPERDLKVGDAWFCTFARPPLIYLPEISKINVKFELLNLTILQGRPCAKLQTTFNEKLALEGTDMGPFGSEGPTTGNLQGDFTWHYDYENSVLVAGEGSGSMEMSKYLKGPLGPGIPDTTVSTKMQMKVKVALVKYRIIALSEYQDF